MKEIHEYAKLFPALPDDQLQELADDIKVNGQREPVMLCERKILDGVHRAKACEMAGVKPFAISFESQPPNVVKGGPLKYVVSQNFHRRHLTPEERRQLGLKLAKLIEEELRHGNGGVSAQPARILSKRGRRGEGKPKSIRTTAIKQAAAKVGLTVSTLNREAAKSRPKKPKKKRELTKTQIANAKEKAERLTQGLTVADSIKKLITKAVRNGGQIYVELNGFSIRCARICRV